MARLSPASWSQLREPIEIVNVHIMGPHTWPYFPRRHTRRGQLAGLLRWLEREPQRPRAVLGDFNSSPIWPLYRSLVARLTDAATVRQGSDRCRTWPHVPALGLAGLIRIDHCFLSNLTARDVQAVPIPGSDHLGLCVDVTPAFAPGAGQLLPALRAIAQWIERQVAEPEGRMFESCWARQQSPGRRGDAASGLSLGPAAETNRRVLDGPRAGAAPAMQRRLPAGIALLFALDLALMLAHVADHLVGSPSTQLRHWLDLDHERSIATWYSSMQWFCAAVLFGLIPAHLRQRPSRTVLALAGVALLCLVFSLDEAIGIHEWLGHKSDALLPGGDRHKTSFARTGVWPL